MDAYTAYGMPVTAVMRNRSLPVQARVLRYIMQLTPLKFIQDQFWKVEPAVFADLTGKTVVVIGANVGLGFETAKHFASMNPKRLVLGCRSPEKGQAAVQGKYVRS